ncbi:MAG TPA: GNAT family N-acetyltransferase [Gemmatimonadaceae bacterium]|nr:GNAT family N-acetyltransferase [Gemmatimonadaceae bacterium]
MPLFDVVITHLELSRDGFQPKYSADPGVSFSHVTPVVPELNRFFYATIGGQWFWLDRRPWTLAEWESHLADQDRIETWILSVRGVPAGYAELERRGDGVVEIVYLGLLRQFIGVGLGAHLLSHACARAFDMGAGIVQLNTCNLDHPKALANYQARGFKPVRTEVKRKEIPASAPGPWDGAV